MPNERGTKFYLEADAPLFLWARNPKDRSPKPSNVTIPGSGTLCGTPGMLTPGVVPKEKNALVTFVAVLTPVTFTINVPVPLINGLCGPFPAMESLAAV